MQERLELSFDRIKEIASEKKLQKEYQSYFEKVAVFAALCGIDDHRLCLFVGILRRTSGRNGMGLAKRTRRSENRRDLKRI